MRAVRALAVLAFGLSLYLALVSARHSGPVGCGSASGCARVLNSPWSRWLGIPVAAPAAALYLVILTAALALGRVAAPRRGAATVLAAASGVACGAAVWFTALQAGSTGFCPWCLAVHACGILTFALALWALAGAPPASAPDRAGATLLCSAGLLALVIGQSMFRPRTWEVQTVGPAGPGGAPPGADAAGVPPHPWFQVPGGRMDLDASRVPLVGSVSADHFIVVLTDYACPHCRATQPVLEQTLRAYGGRVALVVLPTPLDRACNPLLVENHPPEPQDCALNRLALAVWCADPGSFARMDQWLFAAGRARREEEAREFAAALVGAARLSRAESDLRVGAILRQDAEIYARGSGGALPRLMFGATTVSGELDDFRSLAALIEKEWGLRPTSP